MIKGKPPKHIESKNLMPYNVGDWVMVHTGNDPKVGEVVGASLMICNVRFHVNEIWTEVESGLERLSIAHNDIPIPVTSIAFTLPEDVAKNLLLLQGVEL